MFSDRRTARRFPATDLQASFRIPSRLRRPRIMALDFNRFGIGVLSNAPINPGTIVHMELATDAESVSNVRAVVHSCRPLPHGHRIGLQFRTSDAEQLDPEATAWTLLRIELRMERACETASVAEPE